MLDKLIESTDDGCDADDSDDNDNDLQSTGKTVMLMEKTVVTNTTQTSGSA